MRCVSNRCVSGRRPCPTPVACGSYPPPPDVEPPAKPDLGEDESGPMERLERADVGSIASGLVRAVVTILVLLLALFAGGELRDWYRANQTHAGSKG